jgi:hypothetical protein
VAVPKRRKRIAPRMDEMEVRKTGAVPNPCFFVAMWPPSMIPSFSETKRVRTFVKMAGWRENELSV